jgi:CRP-like cAMP-binding protein
MKRNSRPDRCLLCEARLHNPACQLPADSFERFFGGARVQKCAPGAVIFRQGDEARDIVIVRSGQVKLVFQHSDGAEQVVRVAGPGETLGLARRTGDGMALTAVAKQNVSICRTRVDDVDQRLRSDSEFALAWCHMLADEAERTREALALHGPQPATVRLARLLFQAWKAPVGVAGNGRDAEHSHAVHLTHAEIAATLSVVEETITRLLKTLEDQGVVATARGRITILDPDRLNALAGFDLPT